MTQYPLVYLDHVQKLYGKHTALYDVSVNIQPGRIIGLLGPNGSGKTTIIKLINGLLQPTSGNVYIHGQRPSIETKKVISYLPDTTYLDENMKISEAIRTNWWCGSGCTGLYPENYYPKSSTKFICSHFNPLDCGR